MLRSVTVGAKRSLLLAGFTALLVAICVAIPSYAATNTKVNVTVCSGNSSNASLVVGSPVSDSIVTATPLNITGTVGDITQVDISVDGQYNSTIPISVNQTSFLASLQLAEGTHTIILVGNDVCQFKNVTVTLVVTYRPQVSPSLGPVKPTITPTTPSDNFSASGSTVENNNNLLANIPLIGGLAPAIEVALRALDFDVTARHGGIMTAILRFVFFLVGVCLTFFGSIIVRFLYKRALLKAAKGHAAGMEALQDPDLSGHFKRNITLVRSTGVVLLGLAFMI